MFCISVIILNYIYCFDAFWFGDQINTKNHATPTFQIQDKTYDKDHKANLGLLKEIADGFLHALNWIA